MGSEEHNPGHRQDWPRPCARRASAQREPRLSQDRVTGPVWGAEETGQARYTCPHRAVVHWGSTSHEPHGEGKASFSLRGGMGLVRDGRAGKASSFTDAARWLCKMLATGLPGGLSTVV